MPSRKLPSFVEPMLAQSGPPIDSDDYHFEIKWDGIRAVAMVHAEGNALLSRRRNHLAPQFAEFDFLAGLPAGTVLDGEIVQFNAEGKPDFAALMSRERARRSRRLRTAPVSQPATYVVFDQLYDDFQSLVDLPIEQRRQRLSNTVQACGHPLLIQSEVVAANGIAFFNEIVGRGLEGIVAKRRGSRYLPGKRSSAWIKVKRREEILCAIIGYTPKGDDDLENLVLAADIGGQLTYVGRVGTGFTDSLKQSLVRNLRSREVDRPLIHCQVAARWVSAGLFCRIRFTEKTRHGELRDPVFLQLLR